MNEFNFKGPEMYRKGNILAHQGEAPDSYDIIVGDKGLFLDRGQLNEWLSGGIESVERGYKANASTTGTGIIEKDLGISSAELAFALSQVKVSKLEKDITYWSSEAIEAIDSMGTCSHR